MQCEVKFTNLKYLGNGSNPQEQPSLHDKGDKSTLKKLKLNYQKKYNLRNIPV